jgi:hypothetical protein
MSSSVFPVPFSGIQETLIDAKGDLIAGSAADTPARIAVGSNNQVLTADSSTATGLKWATPASNLAVAQISTSSSISGATFSITGLSSYDYLQFKFGNVGWGTSGGWLQFTFNGDTASNYTFQRTVMVRNTAIVLPTMVTTNNTDSAISLSNSTIPFSNSPSAGYGGILTLNNCKATGFTSFELQYNWGDNIGTEETTFIRGIHQSAAAISSVEIKNSSYSLTQGNYTLWGA